MTKVDNTDDALLRAKALGMTSEEIYSYCVIYNPGDCTQHVYYNLKNGPFTPISKYKRTTIYDLTDLPFE